LYETTTEVLNRTKLLRTKLFLEVSRWWHWRLTANPVEQMEGVSVPKLVFPNRALLTQRRDISERIRQNVYKVVIGWGLIWKQTANNKWK
jgi:hypothetical protein